MQNRVYRYQFRHGVAMEDVEAALILAILATENLHGEAAARLDASHYLDRDKHACAIDSSTIVGRDLNRLFVEFLRREIGDDAFEVCRVPDEPNSRSVKSRREPAKG